MNALRNRVVSVFAGLTWPRALILSLIVGASLGASGLVGGGISLAAPPFDGTPPNSANWKASNVIEYNGALFVDEAPNDGKFRYDFKNKQCVSYINFYEQDVTLNDQSNAADLYMKEGKSIDPKKTFAAGDQPVVIVRLSQLKADGTCDTQQPKSILWANLRDAERRTAPAQTGVKNSSDEVSAPQEADDICTSGSFSELNFIFCPLINAGSATIEGIDNAILGNPKTGEGGLLKINADKIFNEKANASARAYHQAWSIFRSIALAILVIVGLIMVVSQIMGLDMFSAYTVRKMLPIIIIVGIFIPISWRAMEFVTLMSNAGIDAVRDILKFPFQDIKAQDGKGLGDVTLAVLIPLLLVGGGAGLAVAAFAFLGIGGIASVVCIALLGVFSAWVMLIAKDTIWALLSMTSSLFLVFYILESTRKFFTIWKVPVITIALGGPAIGALVQASHDAAFVTYMGDQPVIAIVILVAGYALIFSTLAKVDAVSGQLMGAAGKLTQRARAGLRGNATNTAKKRFGWYQEGRLGKENGFLQKSGSALGTYMQSREIPGAMKGSGNVLTKSGRASRRARWGALAENNQRRIGAMRANDDLQKLTMYDDDTQQAATFKSEEDARNNMARLFMQKDLYETDEATGAFKLDASGNKIAKAKGAEKAQKKVEAAINNVKATGGWNQGRRIAAFEAAAGSGTAFTNWEDALTMANDIAGDNDNLRGQMAAKLKQLSVGAGRTDFGAGIGDIYTAIGDMRSGKKSLSTLNHELTVKAVRSQDATSFMRGKEGAVKAGADHVALELVNQERIALDPTKTNEQRQAARKEMAELTVAVSNMKTATNYSSLNNNYNLEDKAIIPTAETRQRVIDASRPDTNTITVEHEDRPLIDPNTGTPQRDSGGRIKYATSQRVEASPTPRPENLTPPAPGAPETRNLGYRPEAYDAGGRYKAGVSPYAAEERDPGARERLGL